MPARSGWFATIPMTLLAVRTSSLTRSVFFTNPSVSAIDATSTHVSARLLLSHLHSTLQVHSARRRCDRLQVDGVNGEPDNCRRRKARMRGVRHQNIQLFVVRLLAHQNGFLNHPVPSRPTVTPSLFRAMPHDYPSLYYVNFCLMKNARRYVNCQAQVRASTKHCKSAHRATRLLTLSL